MNIGIERQTFGESAGLSRVVVVGVAEGGEEIRDDRGEGVTRVSGVAPVGVGDGDGNESLIGAMMCSGENRGKVASLNSLRMLAAFVWSD